MRSSTKYTLAFFISLFIIYLLLLDTMAKPLFESQATEMYGAEVSVESVEISPFVGKITLHQMRVADRADALRNIAQAERVFVDIDMLQLAEDIIDVEQLDIEGLLVFSPRQQPAEILRPLVKPGSDLATLGLPTFDIPDIDQLIARQRDNLDTEINAIKTAMQAGEEKWQQKIASIPDDDAIAAYKTRIKKIKKGGGLAGALASANEVRQVYAEIQQELRRIESMRKEFRGDIAAMRETFALAATLPARHTNQLISSLGLDSSQLAQLGSQLLRGDLAGILQQALAPVAYSNAGKIDPESTMPILIKRATLSGPLLPSGAGLSTHGELNNFTWPLEIAEEAATLALTGETLDGGSLQLDVSVDHRGDTKDRVAVLVNRLPLRHMQLAGGDGMSIFLEQSLTMVSGELSIDGDALSGLINQHFSSTVFDITLDEDADDAARLIAEVLHNSNDFIMSLVLAGTVHSPDVTFTANLDQLIASTVETAIAERVGQLTQDLENQISNEIGPQIATAREQFVRLESLERDLQKNLNQLSELSP